MPKFDCTVKRRTVALSAALIVQRLRDSSIPAHGRVEHYRDAVCAASICQRGILRKEAMHVIGPTKHRGNTYIVWDPLRPEELGNLTVSDMSRRADAIFKATGSPIVFNRQQRRMFNQQ